MARKHVNHLLQTMAVLFCALEPSVVAGYHCSPCVCKDSNGLTAICNKNLTRVPTNLPQNLTVLMLYGNNILEIQCSDFDRYIHLEQLDLSANGIKKIANGTFSKLSGLKVLGLACNDLNYDVAALPERAFSGLNQLKVLSLHNNKWQNATGYREDLYTSLKNLEELYLDGLNSSFCFGPRFKTLRNLKKLYIYGGLDYISNTTFQGFANLQISVVHINSGEVTDLEPLAFSHFQSLTTLSLSGNTKLGLDNASHCFEGLLQVPSLKNLYLQQLVPEDEEELTNLKNAFYDLLINMTIEALRLDANNIGTIAPAELNHLKSLRKVSLNCNHIYQFSDLVNTSKDLKNITFASLAFENSFSDRSECFGFSEYFPDPPKFYGQTCDITQDYQDEKARLPKKEILVAKAEAEEKKKLLLQENQAMLSQQRVYKAENSTCPMQQMVPCPPSLEMLIMRGACTQPISLGSPLCIIGAKSLIYIDYSNMHLDSLGFQINFQPPLSEKGMKLIMRSNSLHYVKPDFLSKSIHSFGLILHSLDLYDNKLGNQLQNATESFLKDFRDLKELNLGENGIKYLEADVFANLTLLENLTLSENSLSEISFDISHMKELRVLNLSHNVFSSMQMKSMNTLNDLIKNAQSPFELDLSYKPLVCSCDTLQFLDWSVVRTISKGKPDKYQCFYLKETKEKLELDTFYRDHFLSLKKSCASKDYLKITVALLALAVVFGAMSFCIHRYRWDLRFFCLKLVSRRKQELHVQDNNACYEYDAFVAFHQNDFNWVQHQLVENLEGPDENDGSDSRGNLLDRFRLCLHHRDFMPGMPIEENIVNAITNSRQVILVVSKDFVTSGWCDFELQMARMRSFDQGWDMIILVMLESVPAQSMTSSLKNLIRQNTYIQWPMKEQDQKAFWRKMKRILSSKEARKMYCECGRKAFPDADI